MSNPTTQGGKGTGFSFPCSNCTKCKNKHDGKWLGNTNGCHCCGKSGHKMRDFPMRTTKRREGKQASTSGAGSNALKHNWFFALQTIGK